MRCRRIPNPRSPAFRDHSSMRFMPFGQLGGFLPPMHHRCLIAPFRQLEHRGAVRHRHHERSHRGFVFPGRACPVSVVGFSQESLAQIAGTAPGLLGRSQRVVYESRQKPKRPYSQPCYGYQHGVMRSAGRKLFQHVGQNSAVAIILGLYRRIHARDRFKRDGRSILHRGHLHA